MNAILLIVHRRNTQAPVISPVVAMLRQRPSLFHPAIFYPVSFYLSYFLLGKLVWVLSARRLQRKLGRELDQSELQGQLRRARIIAVVVTLAFAFFFNLNLIGLPGYG